MGTYVWVSIGSDNGMLPDGTKPLPKPMLTDHHSMKSIDIHFRAISQEMPHSSITKIYLKVTYLKFHSNFPGANELTHCFIGGVHIHCDSHSVAYWPHVCRDAGYWGAAICHPYAETRTLVSYPGASQNVGKWDGLVQECSNSIADIDTLELLQSCTKPSMIMWNTPVSVLFYSEENQELNQMSRFSLLLLNINFNNLPHQG